MITKTGMLASIVMLMQETNSLKTSSSLPWWQVVTGILGIPAAVLGLLYAFWQIRKARLEARKLANDIQGSDPSKSKTQKEDGVVVVARKATLKNAEVGNIVGIESQDNGGAHESNPQVKVLEEGAVEGSKVGDIVGIRKRHPDGGQ